MEFKFEFKFNICQKEFKSLQIQYLSKRIQIWSQMQGLLKSIQTNLTSNARFTKKNSNKFYFRCKIFWNKLKFNFKCKNSWILTLNPGSRGAFRFLEDGRPVQKNSWSSKVLPQKCTKCGKFSILDHFVCLGIHPYLSSFVGTV